MISNSSPQTEQTDGATEGPSTVQAMQELLDRVTRETEQGGRADAIDVLQGLIERVRAQYLRLADVEIQRALTAALALDDQVPDAPEPSSLIDEVDPFLELEALVEGRPFMPRTTQETSAGLAPGDSPTERPTPVDEGPLYEGMVRLFVDAGGNMQRILRFVDELGRKPQLRVLRMTGNSQREGAEIDMGLRERVPFLWLLRTMGHHAEAVDSGPGSGVPRIAVRLESNAE